jgi:hypothetical protein
VRFVEDDTDSDFLKKFDAHAHHCKGTPVVTVDEKRGYDSIRLYKCPVCKKEFFVDLGRT